MNRRPCRPSRLWPALIALAAALFLTSCAGLKPEVATAVAPSAGGETHIVLFHSNDVHGRIDAFAKIGPILEAERQTGADVFYLSAGDNFTGDPVIDRCEPPGAPIIELLSRVGLALFCPGNHEFDYGLDGVRRLAARVPAVSANILPQPGVFPELKPWTTLKTKDGTTLVVFGLIQIEPENGLPSTHPDKVKGLTFREPIGRALEMKDLKSKGQVLIALTHIGHDQDLLLARRMPEIDVIVGGHSHTKVDPAVVENGVLVAQAAAGNAFLGRIDLRLKDGKLIEKKGRLIDLSQIHDEDPAIKAQVAKYRDNPAMLRVLAKAPIEITGMNALGSLMTDAVRVVHGLDAAFQNNGGVRVRSLPKTITLRDVYTLDPFGNVVVRLDLSAEEIRGLVRAGFEKRGEVDLQVSGLTYVVRADEATKQIREIVLRGPDGKPLAEDRTYSVGLSSYIVSSYGFAHKDPGRSLQTTTADALISYLESKPDLSVYRGEARAVREKAPQAPLD